MRMDQKEKTDGIGTLSQIVKLSEEPVVGWGLCRWGYTFGVKGLGL
jgi:hypothetical protein